MSTGIQWTDETWNPTSGCDRVSPGCDHCYAMTLAKRLKAMGSPRYQVDGDPRTSGPGFGVQTHAVALDQPIRWKRPRRIFVNSMSDLFHNDIPDGYIAAVFAVMAAAPQHTFQVLTKRHARMRSLLSDRERFGDLMMAAARKLHHEGKNYPADASWRYPLPNVWLGVSVEDQQWADIRIPALLETPAAVRFLSCEPLLGPVDLRAHDDGQHHWLPDYGPQYDDGSGEPVCPGHGVSRGLHTQAMRCTWIDWVIVGGESGPGARPMNPEWARSLARQCEDAGIPPFVKQLGACWARDHGGDSHGGDWSLWPEDLRVREFPWTPAVAA